MNNLIFKIFLLVSVIFINACSRDESPKISNNFGIDPEKYTGYYKIGSSYQINGDWYHPHLNEEYTQIGIASWYGKKFHGNLTANGEKYNKNSLTAAHQTLPMPSVVKVTNLENNLSVILMINDRGPFNKKGERRIIDVSEKAAEMINMRKQGIAKVRLEYMPDLTKQLHSELGIKPETVLVSGKTKITPKAYDSIYLMNNKTPPPHIRTYYIEIGDYTDKISAINVAKNLSKIAVIKLDKIKKNNKFYYRIKVGPIISEKEAKLLSQKIPKITGQKYKLKLISQNKI